MAANLIPSSHSFRFISLSGSIPKMEINHRIRKMLWHHTFTDIIENTAPFSKTFTLAILTLVNVALKWISSSLYEGDYRSWQHLWRGESLLNLSYMQHLFDNKITLMINPGLSLLNYKLHTQPKCQDWTFRTNSWIRYQLHSNHQFSLGFAMGNYHHPLPVFFFGTERKIPVVLQRAILWSQPRPCETGGRTATAREGRSDEKVAYVYPCLKWFSWKKRFL